MIWLYRILFLPALILASPYYLRRMLRRGGYRENFRQRFGATDPLPPKRPGVKRIWLQAVSVGEMLAIAPLLEALKSAGDTEIYLTTTTSTGCKLALEKYRALTIGIGYFPIDSWFFSRRAWNKITPDLVILTEGERWPEHMRQAARRGVPVIGVNARLSDRSFKRMKFFRIGAPLMLDGMTRLLASSAHDAERFRALGFPGARITTTGNIKLDVMIAPLTGDERTALRKELGLMPGLVVLGSSTWPGEEAALLEAWSAARAKDLAGSLLIVPRHAERRGEIRALLEGSGLRFHFRSTGSAPAEVDVSVADTTGELRRLTQMADIVFIGKTLPPHGEGQTPVEAAALGKPILFGPHMTNFREISRELVKAGAARSVADAKELEKVTCMLLADVQTRATMAAAAQTWQRSNAGAVGRTLAAIRDELAKR